jgi:hypothetical protein
VLGGVRLHPSNDGEHVVAGGQHEESDGAPLRYSRERQVVYSVGEDFTDSGGGCDFDLHNAAEPALRIAF